MSLILQPSHSIYYCPSVSLWTLWCSYGPKVQRTIILSASEASAGVDSCRGCWKTDLVGLFSLHSHPQLLIPKQEQRAWGAWVCRGISLICPQHPNQLLAMSFYAQMTIPALPSFMVASPPRPVLSFPTRGPLSSQFQNSREVFLRLRFKREGGLYPFTSKKFLGAWVNFPTFFPGPVPIQVVFRGSLLGDHTWFYIFSLQYKHTYWPYIAITNVGHPK